MAVAWLCGSTLGDSDGENDKCGEAAPPVRPPESGGGLSPTDEVGRGGSGERDRSEETEAEEMDFFFFFPPPPFDGAPVAGEEVDTSSTPVCRVMDCGGEDEGEFDAEDTSPPPPPPDGCNMLRPV
jgi:hypothetical protein